MPPQTQTAPFIDGLYGKLVEGGIGYFFPSAKFDLLEPDPGLGEHRRMQTSGGTSLILNWLGSQYSLTRDEAFSDAEVKLLTSIGPLDRGGWGFRTAERLFGAALNLAEDRRGGLLVVLDDPSTARKLVPRTDLLSPLPDRGEHPVAGTKGQIPDATSFGNGNPS